MREGNPFSGHGEIQGTDNRFKAYADYRSQLVEPALRCVQKSQTMLYLASVMMDDLFTRKLWDGGLELDDRLSIPRHPQSCLYGSEVA
ncbi:hypothetical protein D3C74_142030 [compost metagenome]